MYFVLVSKGWWDMRNKTNRIRFDIDSWLKLCIKRTFDFYREYSYSFIYDLIHEGQNFNLLTKFKTHVGKFEILEINPGGSFTSDTIIENIIKTFNKKHSLENRKDLDTLIYEHCKNDFSCRVIGEFTFQDKNISLLKKKIEILIPICPNILNPSVTGTFNALKEIEKLDCIVSLNEENNTLTTKEIEYLQKLDYNLAFYLSRL